MPVRSLQVPPEVRNVIRRLHPELKRKLRAALADILDDPTCGKALKEELEGYWSCDWEEVESSIGSAKARSKSLPLVPGKASMKRQLDRFGGIRRNPADTSLVLGVKPGVWGQVFTFAVRLNRRERWHVH